MVLLKEQYGKQVVVNLLGSRGGEEVLNRAFKVRLTLLYSQGPEAGPTHVVGPEIPTVLLMSVLRAECDLCRFWEPSHLVT